jgi:peptidylprolyl isomerase
MRASSVLFLAGVLALSGCQQSSTTSSGGTSNTSSTTSSGDGTAATTESGGASSVSATTTPTAGFDTSTDKSIEVATPGGGSARLLYKDLKVGDGSIAENGKVAMVQYTGWLTDGTKFDSSFDHGQPLQFRIGEGRVIQGWEKGVLGMRVGGTRRLVIPSDLAYGDRGYPPVIPPKATLVFEIELVGLQ